MGIICCLLYLLIGFICSSIMLIYFYKKSSYYYCIDEECKLVSALCVLFWGIIFPIFIFYIIISWWVDFIEDFLRSKDND